MALRPGTFVLTLVLNVVSGSDSTAEPAPTPVDERLAFELFAEHPQVVTPTGLAVDSRGRIFVAESHTHFPPEAYDGPTTDRILILEDTNGDGRADRRRIFHEGFTHTMDMEFHPDGSLYVATRMDIHRLHDSDGDDRADRVDRIVRMKTTGTYPHNGLSGLAFDAVLRLHFGLGENLGADYTLVGTDGTRVSGGGEGGSTYEVNTDGSGLERISTGWWNPFGLCVDAFGRVFGTDNDPGASPPCRLIQVFRGADYGYEYRYGRTGLHPLITWTGDITGTLPMVAGTGEAPCSVLAYEATGLPAEYRGNLLVASWADHRIERFTLAQVATEGLVRTGRQVLVQAQGDFRPVDLAVAPDGSVYVSDWVSSSYTLHGTGRVWRLSARGHSATLETPVAPEEAIASPDRRTRELAARTLAASAAGRVHLREHMLHHEDPRVRVAAVLVLAAAGDADADFAHVAGGDAEIAVRVPALRALLERGQERPQPWAADRQPAALRAEALQRLDLSRGSQLLAQAAEDGDPLLFHAVVEALARARNRGVQAALGDAPRQRLAELLGAKRSGQRGAFARDLLGKFLNAENGELRFAAIKWIADDRLLSYREELAELLDDDELDYRLFLAVTAALDRLDGKPPTDRPTADVLIQRITSGRASIGVRRTALRLLDPAAAGLTDEALVGLTESPERGLRLEAVRTLADRKSRIVAAALVKIAGDLNCDPDVRAAAVNGLSQDVDQHASLLLRLAAGDSAHVRDEALRALVGYELAPEERQDLKMIVARHPPASEAVARLLTGSPTAARPVATDYAAWEELLHLPGDASAGERVFFGARVGTCSSCHQVEGRGAAVGPNLSQIGRRLEAYGAEGTRWLLKTILSPSLAMAPQYTPWLVVTHDGKQRLGLPRRKGGRTEAYLGLDGKEFTVTKDAIAFRGEASESIMPAGLLPALTTQELRDLFAFLRRPLFEK